MCVFPNVYMYINEEKIICFFVGEVQFPAGGWLRQVQHHPEGRPQDLRYIEPAGQGLDQGRAGARDRGAGHQPHHD